MATIITPGQNDTGTSATVWVVGLIIIVLLVGLFAYFVWPNFSAQHQAAVAPATDTSGDNTQAAPVINYTTINASSTTNNSTTTTPIVTLP